jgi:hypothetical protein
VTASVSNVRLGFSEKKNSVVDKQGEPVPKKKGIFALADFSRIVGKKKK